MYVELLGHVYHIRIEDDDWGHDTGKHGHCDRSKQEIVVVQCHQTRFRETLIHEMSHAILYEMGVELDDDIEERVCSAIGQGLAQMLDSNKDVLEMLFPTRDINFVPEDDPRIET